MQTAPAVPNRAHPRRLAALAAVLALGGWGLQAWLSAAEPGVRPGVVLAARAPADAALASPFGVGPAVQAAAQAQPDQPPPPSRPPPSRPLPVAGAAPTLDAAERAEARALLAQAGVLDADSERELDALLYQDALQRFVALRDGGDETGASDELRALAAELRAGLPAREAARDLPAAVLAQARALLQPVAAAASPFAAAR